MVLLFQNSLCAFPHKFVKCEGVPHFPTHYTDKAFYTQHAVSVVIQEMNSLQSFVINTVPVVNIFLWFQVSFFILLFVS